jgi:N utilization substance protein B
MTGQAPEEIERQFLGEHRLGRMDLAYFSEVFSGVTAQADAMDALIDPFLDRPARTLDPVEHALLRLGSYELQERLEVPYRVCLDQAVELAKQFGAEQSHRYINGVLDRVGRTLPLRKAELAAPKR